MYAQQKAKRRGTSLTVTFHGHVLHLAGAGLLVLRGEEEVQDATAEGVVPGLLVGDFDYAIAGASEGNKVFLVE